ncbi:MAG: hypothetical protein Greene041619_91 [Candidatus Peregrinibacteria bacterium Greene0416_19]|nr:MAG: hypothetical protein Greene041619_91 [Candidatus Peregrinibacteria bacterium Greene0416_19]
MRELGRRSKEIRARSSKAALPKPPRKFTENSSVGSGYQVRIPLNRSRLSTPNLSLSPTRLRLPNNTVKTIGESREERKQVRRTGHAYGSCGSSDCDAPITSFGFRTSFVGGVICFQPLHPFEKLRVKPSSQHCVVEKVFPPSPLRAMAGESGSSLFLLPQTPVRTGRSGIYGGERVRGCPRSIELHDDDDTGQSMLHVKRLAASRGQVFPW